MVLQTLRKPAGKPFKQGLIARFGPGSISPSTAFCRKLRLCLHWQIKRCHRNRGVGWSSWSQESCVLTMQGHYLSWIELHPWNQTFPTIQEVQSTTCWALLFKVGSGAHWAHVELPVGFLQRESCLCAPRPSCEPNQRLLLSKQILAPTSQSNPHHQVCCLAVSGTNGPQAKAYYNSSIFMKTKVQY